MYSANSEAVSIDNIFSDFVSEEKETGFCRKLTGVGLLVGPDKWILEKETGAISRDSMVVMSVSKRELRDVALGDVFLACHGSCVLRYTLSNIRDSWLLLELLSFQFR